MNTNGKEIERKYLIKYPDLELLTKKSFSVKEIVQTYLSSEKGIDRRVRSSRENGTVTYTFTEKRKITDLTRFEDEREISREEYEALLTTADGDFDPIYKTRYCIESGERVAEVDVYKDVSDFAICEVELCDENESVTLPDCITLIREVSGEKKYTNRYMAKRNK
ncbi:MAG: hypothetical protein E7601_05980 [Ruminococcaceae bacterium]|nr:hypothetical protein [Oscillospiraceae bacterium]